MPTTEDYIYDSLFESNPEFATMNELEKQALVDSVIERDMADQLLIEQPQSGGLAGIVREPIEDQSAQEQIPVQSELAETTRQFPAPGMFIDGDKTIHGGDETAVENVVKYDDAKPTLDAFANMEKLGFDPGRSAIAALTFNSIKSGIDTWPLKKILAPGINSFKNQLGKLLPQTSEIVQERILRNAIRKISKRPELTMKDFLIEAYNENSFEAPSPEKALMDSTQPPSMSEAMDSLGVAQFIKNNMHGDLEDRIKATANYTDYLYYQADYGSLNLKEQSDFDYISEGMEIIESENDPEIRDAIGQLLVNNVWDMIDSKDKAVEKGTQDSVQKDVQLPEPVYLAPSSANNRMINALSRQISGDFKETKFGTETVQGLKDVPVNVRDSLRKGTAGLVRAFGEMIGNEDISQLGAEVAGFYASELQDRAVKLTTPFARFVAGAAQSFGQSILTIPAGIAAAPIVGPTAALLGTVGIGFGLPKVGQKYQDLREHPKTKYKPSTSLGLAGLYGMTEVGGELLSFKLGKLLEPGYPLFKKVLYGFLGEILGEEVTEIGDIALDVATTNPDMTYAEMGTRLLETAAVAGLIGPAQGLISSGLYAAGEQVSPALRQYAERQAKEHKAEEAFKAEFKPEKEEIKKQVSDIGDRPGTVELDMTKGNEILSEEEADFDVAFGEEVKEEVKPEAVEKKQKIIPKEKITAKDDVVLKDNLQAFIEAKNPKKFTKEQKKEIIDTIEKTYPGVEGELRKVFNADDINTVVGFMKEEVTKPAEPIKRKPTSAQTKVLDAIPEETLTKLREAGLLKETAVETTTKTVGKEKAAEAKLEAVTELKPIEKVKKAIKKKKAKKRAQIEKVMKKKATEEKQIGIDFTKKQEVVPVQPSVKVKPPVVGKKDTGKAGDIEIDYEYKVHEQRDIRPSHDMDGIKDTTVPEEMQPRTKDRMATPENIANIYGEHDPRQTGESGFNIEDGAPLIRTTKKGIFNESGNTRTAILQRLYAEAKKGVKASIEKINNYKNWLKNNAASFGMTAEQIGKMDEPILVRERTTALTPDQQREFIDALNKGGQAMALAPSESEGKGRVEKKPSKIEQADKEIAEGWKEFKEAKPMPGMIAVNPKRVIAAAKIIKGYLKKGIYTFQDILIEIKKKVGKILTKSDHKTIKTAMKQLIADPAVDTSKVGMTAKDIDAFDVDAFFAEKPKAEPKVEPAKKPEVVVPEVTSKELPKYAASVNLERIEAKDSVKELILEVSEKYKDTIDEKRRGVITHEETQDIADQLGLTPKQLLKRKTGTAWNAEQIKAARDILNSSATELNKIREKAVENPTETNLADFKIAWEKHAMIQAEVSGLATEAGRALSAHRIASIKNNKATRNYKAMIKAMNGKEFTEEQLKMLSMINPENQGSVNKFIRETNQATTFDMLYEAWINFILSSPQTHAVNILSNTLTFGSGLIEKATGITLDLINSKLTGKQRERFFGEIPAEISGITSGLTLGTQRAVESFQSEIASDFIDKLETGYVRQAIPSKKITLWGKEHEIGGKQMRIPGRALIAADEFFKALNYETAIRSLAFREATKEGLTGKEKIERINDILKNPSEEMNEKAREEMLYRVFQKELGEVGKWFSKGRSIPVIGPILKFVVPFIKTPTNIAKFGLERTPLNLVRLFYKKAFKGELQGAEFTDELAKPLLGSVIGATVFMAALAGSIIGGGPREKEKREAKQRTGWQPYSFKYKGKYYSYGRLEPLGMVLGTAADAAEIWEEMNQEDRENIAAMISMSIARNITNKTFMKGLSDMLNAYSDPSRHGKRWIQGFAASTVPYSSFLSTLRRAKDPIIRDTHTTLEKIKSRVPTIYGKKLPARLDIWGRPIRLGEGGFFERMLSPIYRSSEVDNGIDKEIVRLRLNAGMPSRTIANQGRKLKMIPDEYWKYVEMAGTPAEKELIEVTKTSSYKKMNDDEKKDKIKTVIRKHRKIARAKIWDMISDERKKEAKGEFKPTQTRSTRTRRSRKRRRTIR